MIYNHKSCVSIPEIHTRRCCSASVLLFIRCHCHCSCAKSLQLWLTQVQISRPDPHSGWPDPIQHSEFIPQNPTRPIIRPSRISSLLKCARKLTETRPNPNFWLVHGPYLTRLTKIEYFRDPTHIQLNQWQLHRILLIALFRTCVRISTGGAMPLDMMWSSELST